MRARFKAGEARSTSQVQSQNVAHAGYPRDANGREYSCTIGEPTTNQDQINSYWHMYPGGREGKPMPTGGTIRFVDCKFVDPSIPDTEFLEGVDAGWTYFAPPEEVLLEGYLIEARRELVPPAVQIRTWPDEQFVVGVPTRFRVENYGVIASDAGTPNVWVRAQATPTRVVWRFGDVSVQCAFAGKEFTGGDDSAPDACKHTFHRRTDGFQTATVTVHYSVTWTSNLRDGVQTLPPIQSQPLSFTYGVRGYEAVVR